uniref:Ovule protein n=1 Tax=Schistosoma curassoni TaxID=6186 RepID=A0A183KUM0_9TREM
MNIFCSNISHDNHLRHHLALFELRIMIRLLCFSLSVLVSLDDVSCTRRIIESHILLLLLFR